MADATTPSRGSDRVARHTGVRAIEHPPADLTSEQIGKLESHESATVWPLGTWTGPAEFDLTGQHLGSLTVLGRADSEKVRELRGLPPSGSTSAQWVCRCSCGVYVLRKTKALRGAPAGCSLCSPYIVRFTPIESEVDGVRFLVTRHAVERAAGRLGMCPGADFWAEIIRRGAKWKLRARSYNRRGSPLDRDVFDDGDVRDVELMADALADQVRALLLDLGGRALLAVLDEVELVWLCRAAISSAYEHGHAASERREFARSRQETGSLLSAILTAANDAVEPALDKVDD